MVKRKTTRRKTTKRRTTTRKTTRKTTKTKRKTTKKRKSTTSWASKQKRRGKKHSSPYKADSHKGVRWEKKSVGKKCSICSGPHSRASHAHHGPNSHMATRGKGRTKQYVAYQRKTGGYSRR